MLTNTLNRANRVRLNVEHLEKRLVLDRTVLDMTHVHIAMEFDGSALAIELEDTSTKTFYEPSQVLLYLNPNTRAIQPSGWNFIGAGDGNQFWQLPEEKDPSVLTIAFSGEDIDPGTFDTWTPYDPRIGRAGEWIKVSLRDVNGPGEFSVWQDFQAPNAWWMSTVDGGRTFDPAFYLEPGGDNHIDAGFTATGTYMVTIEASAFLNGHGLPIRSDPATLCFGVESTDGCDAADKPGTTALLSATTIEVDPGLQSIARLIAVSRAQAPLDATAFSTGTREAVVPHSYSSNQATGSSPEELTPVPQVAFRHVADNPAIVGADLEIQVDGVMNGLIL